MELFSRLLLVALLLLGSRTAQAQTVTRAEVLAVARTFAELSWQASAANVLQGEDPAGVAVSTPSLGQEGHWQPGVTNLGMPYKWGGFDSLESFANGLHKGRAAGDLYTADKRRQADRAVSNAAVGVDCSGFVSRCWRLPKKHGTSMLPNISMALRSPAELKTGDIMNVSGGHVVLFAEWLDAEREHARFYEAEPFSKVRASEYSTRELTARGFQPWRFRKIRD